MSARPDSGEAYLLYHSIGQYPGKEADLAREMSQFARIWSAPDDGQWGEVLAKRARFLSLWEQLIKAPLGSMTTTESVTSGLMSVIGALPRAALEGKTVLVAEDGFPSLHFLLSGLQARYGFTLKTVPLRQGAHWVEDEDILSEWNEDVGVALLTWISSTSSHRNDIPALVAHGRQMGSVIGVDITQGAGLLPYDVSAPEVDFLISTSLKWLCGTPGAGVIYMRPELTGQCTPDLRGWFSQANPFSWALDQFSFAPDARRFDSGTPACVPALASLPALDWRMAQEDAPYIAHNRTLTETLCAGLMDMGLTLASPADPDQRGGSLMVSLPAEQDGQAVVAELRRRGIYMDHRGQILRMSPGVLTTVEGVDYTLEALRQILG